MKRPGQPSMVREGGMDGHVRWKQDGVQVKLVSEEEDVVFSLACLLYISIIAPLRKSANRNSTVHNNTTMEIIAFFFDVRSFEISLNRFF